MYAVIAKILISRTLDFVYKQQLIKVSFQENSPKHKRNFNCAMLVLRTFCQLVKFKKMWRCGGIIILGGERQDIFYY